MAVIKFFYNFCFIEKIQLIKINKTAPANPVASQAQGPSNNNLIDFTFVNNVNNSNNNPQTQPQLQPQTSNWQQAPISNNLFSIDPNSNNTNSANQPSGFNMDSLLKSIFILF